MIGNNFPEILSDDQFEGYLSEIESDEVSEVTKARIVGEIRAHFKVSHERNEKVRILHDNLAKVNETLVERNHQYKELIKRQEENSIEQSQFNIESFERGGII